MRLRSDPENAAGARRRRYRLPATPRQNASALLVLATLSIAGLVVSACGASSSADGVQACTHVEKSLQLYAEANAAAQAGHPAVAGTDRMNALTELRDALPLASIAAGSDGTWQPLEATLSESNRVAEAHLVTALSAQCDGVVPGS